MARLGSRVMSESQRRYHHGNLKDALIIAAAELIETQGTTDFSITDAANLAGVSNAAPYRHFRDKQDLLEHVKELAFLGLYEALVEARGPANPHQNNQRAVISLGLAYLRFAREKHRFFSLMWEQLPLPDITITKAAAFYVLVDAIAEFLAGNAKETGTERTSLVHERSVSDAGEPNIEDARALQAATQLWALAHGLATLEQNELLNRFDRSANAEQLLVTSAEALLAAYT